MTAIAEIRKEVEQIKKGLNDRVRPGQPIRFSEAAAPGDAIRQGDLYIVVVDSVPQKSGYSKVEKLGEEHRQLVPGNTQGAKHALDSLQGVEMWRPDTWNEDILDGPYIRCLQERTITHPTHGAVTIPKGFTVKFRYQKEWDREQEKERRARD